MGHFLAEQIYSYAVKPCPHPKWVLNKKSKRFLSNKNITRLDLPPSVFIRAVEGSSRVKVADFGGGPSVMNLRNRLCKHRAVDVPYLSLLLDDNKIIDHEGRTRSFVARALGMKKIPVAIMCTKREGDAIVGTPCPAISDKTIRSATSQFKKRVRR